MATYEELYGLISNPSLFMKFRIAIGIVINVIRLEASTVPNHDKRLAWAKRMHGLPRDKVTEIMMAGLMNQAWDSASNIATYPDNTVQFIVDGLVGYFSNA